MHVRRIVGILRLGAVLAAPVGAIWTNGWAAEFFVSPTGDDRQPGTAAAPFATLERARAAVRAGPRSQAATVWLQGGVHRLAQTLVFTAEDGGAAAAPVTYAAVAGQTVEISGAQILRPEWSPAGPGRWSAKVPPGLDFDQLFADGRKMIRARHPNFDPGEGFFGGLSRDATAPERLRRYADPVGLFVHGYHGLGWGSLHFQVLQKSPEGSYHFEAGKDPRLAGGWQNKGRALIAEAPFSPDQRFVENVLEELDAPKEWYLDRRSATLHFIPPEGTDPRRMVFEAVTVRHLIELRGTQAAPVRHLTFRGLAFRKAGYTFMETSTVPSGGDWRIHRGGAVVLAGAEDCAVRDCTFDGVGGNGVCVRDYNRRIEITGCEFTRIGASAVLFDGDAAAVRSRWAHSWGWPAGEEGPRPVAHAAGENPVFLAMLPKEMLRPEAPHPLVDLRPGPKTDNYPAHCLVRDCLMVGIGTVEKQIAGVFISKSSHITVSHVTIHDVPRAAININDGMWGGHVIEWCDVFNTCLESREHGAFNSWGRDRHWVRLAGRGRLTPEQYAWMRDAAKLDAVEVITLRNNRLQCAAGYDIDLDDGSTHYLIENNLCLQGGIKLREGFYRTVRNNISPLFSPHVWYPDSRDVVTQNILVGEKAYDPRGMGMEGAKDGRFDRNLFALYVVSEALQRLGFDRNSLRADPRFVNTAAGDFRVQAGSPAESIGFQNFPMDRFGAESARLRSPDHVWSGLGRALQPASAGGATGAAAEVLYRWQGATLRNLVNFGRESAIVSGMELANNRGILIKAVAADSVAARAKLPSDAVILAANDAPVADVAGLTAVLRQAGGRPVGLRILTATGTIEVAIDAGTEEPAAEAAPPAAGNGTKPKPRKERRREK